MASAFVFAPPALVSVPLTGNVEPIDARPGRKERQMNPDTDHPRRRSGVSSVLPLLALVALGAAAAPASAAFCTFSGAALTAVNFGTVHIPRDALVGTRVSPVQRAALTITCPPSIPGTNANGNAHQIIGPVNPAARADSYEYTWKTPLAGVGLRLESDDPAFYVMSGYISSDPVVGFGNLKPSATTTTRTVNFSYSLYKTAMVTAAGPLSLGSLQSIQDMDYTNDSTARLGPMTDTASVTAMIAVPTCSTSSVSVNLKPISPSALPAVGSVAGSTPFNIVLQCPAAGPRVNVRTTLTDATTPGNRTSTLSLARASSATGVAVQIRNAAGLVSYGPDNPVVQNPNQFQVSALSAAGGTINIPLTAEYVSTGAVTPGTVVALATFTMSYQ